MLKPDILRNLPFKQNFHGAIYFPYKTLDWQWRKWWSDCPPRWYLWRLTHKNKSFPCPFRWQQFFTICRNTLLPSHSGFSMPAWWMTTDSVSASSSSSSAPHHEVKNQGYVHVVWWQRPLGLSDFPSQADGVLCCTPGRHWRLLRIKKRRFHMH